MRTGFEAIGEAHVRHIAADAGVDGGLFGLFDLARFLTSEVGLLAVIIQGLARDEARRTVDRGKHRVVLGLDENLQIGDPFRRLGDFRQDKGINVAAGGNQVEIGFRARLGRLHVGHVLRAVDDPVLLVTAGVVEDFFAFRKHDQGGVPEFRFQSDDIPLAVMDDPGDGLDIGR